MTFLREIVDGDKEFAQQSGIDTFQLDNRAPVTHSHSENRKMPGGEISASSTSYHKR